MLLWLLSAKIDGLMMDIGTQKLSVLNLLVFSIEISRVALIALDKVSSKFEAFFLGYRCCSFFSWLSIDSASFWTLFSFAPPLRWWYLRWFRRIIYSYCLIALFLLLIVAKITSTAWMTTLHGLQRLFLCEFVVECSENKIQIFARFCTH